MPIFTKVLMFVVSNMYKISLIRLYKECSQEKSKSLISLTVIAYSEQASDTNASTSMKIIKFSRLKLFELFLSDSALLKSLILDFRVPVVVDVLVVDDRSNSLIELFGSSSGYSRSILPKGSILFDCLNLSAFSKLSVLMFLELTKFIEGMSELLTTGDTL